MSSALAAEQFFLVNKWGSYSTIEGKFRYPHAVAVGPDGNVFVADTGNNRVQKFSPDGTLLSKWGEYGSKASSFNAPQGIAVDNSGNVYVADTGNNRVQKFSRNGTFIAKWGSYGSGDGKLKHPTDIAVDPSSDVYVADTLNNSIRKFSNNGTFIATIGSFGSADGKFRYPRSVAIDAAGDVYVADTGNNRVQKFSENGTFIAAWGSYGNKDGSFNAPQAVATDSEGNVYVADTLNNRIQKFTNNGTFISNEGSYGKTEGAMNQVADISIDSSGNIFAVDLGNHRILHYIFTQSEDYDNINIVEGQPFVKDPNLRVETVTDKLVFPTNMVFLGPEDILILQKDKPSVYRIVDKNVTGEPVLELDLGGQFFGCMCGIATTKNEEGTVYVFLYYYILRSAGDNSAGGYLYRYELIDNKMVNPKLLIFLPTSENSIHMGGEVIIGPDDNVYLIMGNMDGHKTMAQNIVDGADADGTSAILRVTQDGEAIIDENSLGIEAPLNKYYAYGIRNSFGMDFDPISGKLWDTENGPDRADEINLVEQRFNSGFQIIQGMSSRQEGFDPNQLVDFDGKGKYSDPEFEWINPIGPTAIEFLNSAKLGELYENDLFVSDVNNGNVYHFELNEHRTELALSGTLADRIANNILEREQAIFASGFSGITDMQTGPEGYLYVVSITGKIFRIVPNDLEAS